MHVVEIGWANILQIFEEIGQQLKLILLLGPFQILKQLEGPIKRQLKISQTLIDFMITPTSA